MKFINPVLTVISVALTFCLLELATRIYKQDFSVKNYLIEHINLFRASYPVQYDDELGWIPKVGPNRTGNVWGTTVTIHENGIRSNGLSTLPNNQKSSTPILVVGDSFTFGDEVSDHETWPAILELLSGKKVINAGVFGYGMDQAFLRAKNLIPIYQPDILIFSCIPDDILRCALSKRTGVSKPYFEVLEGSLVLRNEPVPYPATTDIGAVRRLLGYSLFVHKFMARTFPTYWLHGLWQETKIHNSAEQVACLLLKQLRTISEPDMKIIVLIQYPAEETIENIDLVQRITSCIDTSSIQVIDLKNSLEQIKKHNPDKFAKLFNFSHMTYEGNYFVAETVSRAVNKKLTN